MKNNITNSILKLLILFFSIFCIYILYNYFAYSLIGWDSGYYMSVGQQIKEGKKYYIDIATSYNPLAILILSIPFIFTDFPDIRFSLFINVVFMVFNALLFYKIISKFSSDKLLNILFSILLFYNFLILDGCDIMLEAISIFFQLLCLNLYLKHKKYIFFCGLCIGFSFLSKQYGLFIYLPIIIHFLFNKNSLFNSKIKAFVLLHLGILLSIIPVFGFLYFNNLTIYESINYLLGKSVKLDYGTGTGNNYDYKTFVETFNYFKKHNYYILALPILFTIALIKKNNISFFYYLLFISSTSVLLFASYPHYYQYITPYLLFLLLFLLKKIINKMVFLIFILSVLYSLIPAHKNFMYWEKIRQNRIIEQNKLSVLLNNFIPKNSHVYIDGESPGLYYFNQYQSINLKKVGYTFPGFFKESTLINYANTNSYFIVSKEVLTKYKNHLHKFDIKKFNLDDREIYILKLIKK
jgi:hypothetical protein